MRIVSILLFILFLSCSGSQKEGAKPPPLKSEEKGEEDFRAQCEVKGDRIEKSYDLNRDKAIDVREVYNGKTLICREVDLNFDGKMDLFRYYDERGVPRQEEIDLDKDGRLDIVTYFDERGKIIRQEFDTNYDNKADVWRYFKGDKVERIARDIDYNGKPDIWTICKDGKPVKEMLDIDGDGKPEQERKMKIEADEEISVNECSSGIEKGREKEESSEE